MMSEIRRIKKIDKEEKGKTDRGALLMRAKLPKSSPSWRVVTVPLPWITTLTEPLRITYHEVPSSP